MAVKTEKESVSGEQKLSFMHCFSLSVLTAIFPGEPGAILELRIMEVVVTAGATYVQSSSQIVTANKPTPSFLQAGCSSRMPSVEALKGNFIYFIFMHC